MANHSNPLQLINEDMALDKAGLQSFVQTVLHGDGAGARYVAVSIVGPQSSGKSTLLNSLFGIDFQMMDATKDWVQTTKGICLGKFKEVLVMDVEGTDSGERQGQIKCEGKFAAFCFAMSQVVLVNMKNDSIGLDSGGCKSLLKAALEFMVCFLGHHKITLINVVRDKHPDTSVVTIEKKVTQSIDQIWTNIRKPEGFQDKKFDDCLDVKVVVMDSYVYQKDIFVKEHSVKQQMKLRLAKHALITPVLAGAVAVDVVVTGGAATAATAAVGTAADVSAGVAVLAGGVSAAQSYSVVGAVKNLCKDVKFFAKNRNYHPEKPSASGNLKKP